MERIRDEHSYLESLNKRQSEMDSGDSLIEMVCTRYAESTSGMLNILTESKKKIDNVMIE